MEAEATLGFSDALSGGVSYTNLTAVDLATGNDLARVPLTASSRTAVDADRTRPLVIDVHTVSAAERPVVRSALQDASVRAFRIGMVIAGLLAMLGGIVSLVGVVNPRKRVPAEDCGGCGFGPGPQAGVLAGGESEPGREAQREEPVPA